MNKKLIFLIFLLAAVTFSSTVKTYPSNIDWRKLNYNYVYGRVSTAVHNPYAPGISEPNILHSYSALSSIKFLFFNQPATFEFGFNNNTFEYYYLTPGVYILHINIASGQAQHALYRLDGTRVKVSELTADRPSTIYYRANVSFVIHHAIGSSDSSKINSYMLDLLQVKDCQSQKWKLFIINMSGQLPNYNYKWRLSTKPDTVYDVFTHSGGPAVGFITIADRAWVEIIGPTFTFNATAGCLYIINDNNVTEAFSLPEPSESESESENHIPEQDQLPEQGTNESENEPDESENYEPIEDQLTEPGDSTNYVPKPSENVGYEFEWDKDSISKLLLLLIVLVLIIKLLDML